LRQRYGVGRSTVRLSGAAKATICRLQGSWGCPSNGVPMSKSGRVSVEQSQWRLEDRDMPAAHVSTAQRSFVAARPARTQWAT
jgi:hypothetical protein